MAFVLGLPILLVANCHWKKYLMSSTIRFVRYIFNDLIENWTITVVICIFDINISISYDMIKGLKDLSLKDYWEIYELILTSVSFLF